MCGVRVCVVCYSFNCEFIGNDYSFSVEVIIQGTLIRRKMCVCVCV